MKAIRLPSGSVYYAQEHNALRSDAAISAMLHVHQQLGALALGTTPSNNQTITFDINGTNVVFNAVTGTPTNPGDVKAPGTAVGFVANLYAALINPTVSTSTFIALSSANAILVQYLGWALPSGGTTITPFSLNTSTYAPLTSFSASTTVTSGSWTAQTMQLYVQPGTYYVGTTRILFLGGSTPTITAPSSHPRIDLVTADSSGTIALVTGTEAASPTVPSYPANKLVLAEIMNVVSETALYDNDNQQTGQGYVLNDVRPGFAPPYLSSTSQAASGLFIPDPGSEAQGDVLYYNGAAWARLPAGTAGNFLETLGGSANPTWTNPFTNFSFSGGWSTNFGSICVYDDMTGWSETSSTPTPVTEIQFPAGMPTITLTFAMRILNGNGGTYTTHGRFYKNNSTAGADHTVTSVTPVNFTDSISVTGGDKVELYLSSSNGSSNASAAEVAILLIPVPSSFVPAKLS